MKNRTNNGRASVLASCPRSAGILPASSSPPWYLQNHGGTGTRLLTALVLIPLALAMIWAPALNEGFVLFVAAIAGIGAWEFQQICKAKGIETAGSSLIAFAVAVVLIAYTNDLAAMMLVFFAGAASLAFLHIIHVRHTIAGLSASIFGLLYTGLLPAHFVLVHNTPALGPGLVTLLIAAVGLSDTGAYFTGRAIGKHKLAPKVSPNKTIEGAVGGVIWAALGMLLAWWLNLQFNLTPLPDWSLTFYLGTGIALALVSQVGDLMESMIKRDAGVKDSGTIFPGHGGALDRCDGFLFAGPVLYYLLVL